MRAPHRWLEAGAIAACAVLSVTACSSNSHGAGSGNDGGGPYSTAAHTTFVMPRVIGKSLPVAQLALQTAARNQLLNIRPEDATGRDRQQDVPSDWRVCRQSTAAGKVVDQSTYVTLSVVKLAEACPPS
jgi:hypothetical protein